MKPGDVILSPVTQAEGRIKNRPAVALREMRPFGDFLICGISTQLHQRVPAFDEVISPADSDFLQSGLLKTSLIRLGFLMIVPQKNIAGVIGSIAPERHQRLLKTLSDYLTADEG
jgi:mRNA interferase MazF